ncbi:phytanoyl-CoA dioxygenase family protein [Ferruginibacter yonginensis]|uniref:Phytanoyl-CoA dioxygenase family protein n=1 Tax=Ferruginibacter yonginensis TaxID=1310416 RepID=A0ABV8QPS9_9BACT
MDKHPNNIDALMALGAECYAHLKSLWQHTLLGIADNITYNPSLNHILLDILGVGLLPTYQFLHTQQPSFAAFEQWILAQNSGNLTATTIAQCQQLFSATLTSAIPTNEAVLSEEDLDFWDTHGYVIIKNAVSKEDCTAACDAIWKYLQMDAADSNSWYQASDAVQGIMVPLYRHAAIDANRNNPVIKKAFQQLWGHEGLVVTTDKCGFNPPETAAYTYRGIGLHWDVSLAQPIPFGTQGILYLTDTAAHQGALTVVPGFHHQISDWLYHYSKDTHPRDDDFTAFEKVAIAGNAGDFIIWNHLLPHSSSANKATTPRLVQYINWYDPLQKVADSWI